MNPDDLLKDAVRALREETAANDDCAALTRARVMASLHTGRRRRRWHLAVLVPIAAVLAVSTALGATGTRWADVSRALGVTRSATEPATPPAQRVIARGPIAPVLKQVTEPAPEPEPEPAPPPEKVEPVRPPSRGAAADAGARHAADPDLASYRQAHAAHFSGGDPAAALAAWDRYLERAPSGRFAPEARYNRAICLARLGRIQEAQSALEPFASGRYGGYRQESARALLDALGER